MLVVRGQEALNGWRPHGVALVDLLANSRAEKERLARVQGTRAMIEAIVSTSVLRLPTFGQEDLEKTRLEKALELWQKYRFAEKEVRFGTRRFV